MPEPTGSTKRNVCGVWIDAIEKDEAVERILDSARKERPLAASALAVHGIMTGVRSRAYRIRLNEFDLVLPDGQPVRWTLNALYRTGLRERVYGPALMEALCEEVATTNMGVYLYGSSDPVLDRLEERLRIRFPDLRVAGRRASRYGPLNEAEQRSLGAEIRESGAGICFVGLGCPRQELFCWAMREPVGIPLIAVGAAFDFHAGTVPEAPEWMQRKGLQWLHRLASEPRRLWRRYLLLNPAYAVLAVAQFTRVWRPPITATEAAGRSSVTLEKVPG
jgi:exopolysaccharide biosynthesis WecB/TagA/CpsF family protein